MDPISLQRANLLHPYIREEVLTLLKRVDEEIGQGTVITRIVQGLRTIGEQNKLYAQGRTLPGPIVTKAKGGSSFHNYGLAIDVCWLWKDNSTGLYKYDEEKSWLVGPKFKQMVQLFKDHGYTWGGDWHSIKDTPHFEKTHGYSWRQLYRKYLNNDFIQGTQYVNL